MPNLSMMFEIHLKAAVVEDCDLLKNLREFSMSESEFLALAEAVLDAIETGMECAGEAADVDLECSRSGNVLEIEFIDQGSKSSSTPRRRCRKFGSPLERVDFTTAWQTISLGKIPGMDQNSLVRSPGWPVHRQARYFI